MHPGDVPSDLRVDTTGERVGDGVYRIDLPDAWNYQMPSGGVLMSTSLRAMQSELFDDTFRPASATTIFCEPVPHGRLVCEVTVLRKGNLATQVRSSLRHESSTKTAMETIATFTRDRPGIRVRDAVFPEVPMPRDARAWEEPPIGVARKTYPIFDQLDQRAAIGNKWWEKDWQGGDAHFARWFRPLVSQVVDGVLDPLCLPPFVDTMPPALRQKLGPEAPQFYAPSLDLTVHFLEPTTSDWLLVDVRCRAAVGTYATADVNVWGEDGKLAAYGTQTMFLRLPK